MSAILLVVPQDDRRDWLGQVTHRCLARLRATGHVLGTIGVGRDGVASPALRSALDAVDGLLVAGTQPNRLLPVIEAFSAMPRGSCKAAVSLSILASGTGSEPEELALQRTLIRLGVGHPLPVARLEPQPRRSGWDRLAVSLSAFGDICAVGTPVADSAMDEP